MTNTHYMDPREALRNRVRRQGDCLIWTGASSRDGYANITVEKKRRNAHRVAYELTHGPIPNGLQVDHACHNRACVNVDHLRLVTRLENQRNQSGPHTNSTTGVRNVYERRGKFIVQIRVGGKAVYFGTYSSIAEAGRVADMKRAEMFGHFAGRGTR